MLKSNYYELPEGIAAILVNNGMIDDLFRLKDLEQRKLFLVGDIDSLSAFDIVKNIMQYNSEDYNLPRSERKPIWLYINSNGGETNAALSMIDAITHSITPVYTVNLSCAFSSGFLVSIAGHKRFALPNSKYLMHDGSIITYNSTTKAHDELKFNIACEERIKKYILGRGTIAEDEYDKKLRVEWYMFADEAKDNGFVDYIVGSDVALEDVVGWANRE